MYIYIDTLSGCLTINFEITSEFPMRQANAGSEQARLRKEEPSLDVCGILWLPLMELYMELEAGIFQIWDV